MSESYRSMDDSPLQTGRGTTTIADGVVSKIAGMSAQEVEGVHMGGSASRTAGGLLENITGSESQTRGVSVEVGKIETAIDLKIGIDYGSNILRTVEDVRRRITERLQNMTGLRVTELNVTIADIVFPDGGQGGRPRSGDGTRDLESGETEKPEARSLPRSELRTGASERETTPVEPRSRTYTEGTSGPVPEEEVRVEGRPLDEDETAELRSGEATSFEQQQMSEEEQRAATRREERERRRRHREEREEG